MFVLKAAALSALALVVVGFAPGDPCVSGAFCASSFSNIILRCNAGKLEAGNCNDNLAGVPPVGVKTDAICGNSTVNNADCFLPPYPPFIIVPGNSTTTTARGKNATTTTIPAGNATTSIPIVITKSTSTAQATVILSPTASVVGGGASGTPVPTHASTGVKISVGLANVVLVFGSIWGFML